MDQYLQDFADKIIKYTDRAGYNIVMLEQNNKRKNQC